MYERSKRVLFFLLSLFTACTLLGLAIVLFVVIRTNGELTGLKIGGDKADCLHQGN